MPAAAHRVKLVSTDAIDGNAEWAAMNGIPAELPEAMGEGDFQAICEDVLRKYGWTVYHETDSRKSPKGLPDLIALSPLQQDGTIVLLMVELKSKKGKTTDEQDIWLDGLRRSTWLITGLARPADWPKLSAIFFDPSGVCTRAQRSTPDGQQAVPSPG